MNKQNIAGKLVDVEFAYDDITDLENDKFTIFKGE